MLVILKRDAFIGGRRFRKGPNGQAVEIADKYTASLPRDAKIVDEQVEVEAAPEGPSTLSEASELLAPSDLDGEAAKIVSEAHEEANKPATPKRGAKK
jgi:hypothetical protein